MQLKSPGKTDVYSVELHGSFVYCCRLSFPSFHAAIASFSAVFIAVSSFVCVFAFDSGEGNVLLCVYVSVCIIIQNVADGLDEILSVDSSVYFKDFWTPQHPLSSRPLISHPIPPLSSPPLRSRPLKSG